MPQYLLSVWHDEDYVVDFSTPEAQERVAQVGAFNDELQRSGAWVFAAGLHPASSATVVRSSGGDVSMTDGPYAETEEVLAGYWLVDCDSFDRATEIAARLTACPGPEHVRDRAYVDVRPVAESQAELGS